MNRARILIADDNELLLPGWHAEMLATSFDVVGLAHDGREVIAMAQNFAPDMNHRRHYHASDDGH